MSNFIRGYEPTIYKAICKKSGSKQAVEDVGYMNCQVFRGCDAYAERIDESACIFGYFNKNSFRIVCTAVDEECKRRGYGSSLLYRAMEECRKRGVGKITTRTFSGKRFYESAGFVVVGQKEGDYLMEAIV